MISNLINNSVESCKKNSVIKISLSSSDEKLMVELEDNGQGMPQNVVDQILNKTAPKSTKRNGFGFGLIQVLETVKRYNGRLDVTSIEGKGTKFQIEFPLVS